MRGLSLLQPWSSLIACDEKRIETRDRRPPNGHRGLLAIHASARWDQAAAYRCFTQPYRTVLTRHTDTLAELPLGAIVAVADLWRVERTDDFTAADFQQYGAEHERAFGNYAPGRWAWFLRDVVKLPVPVPAKGMLGLWELPEPVLAAVEAGIAAAGRRRS